MHRGRGPNWVVFGSGDYPNKCIAYERAPDSKTVTLHIYEADNSDRKLVYGDSGETIESSRIQFEYVRLMFCKKESVKAMLDAMQDIYDRWDEPWEIPVNYVSRGDGEEE